MGKNVGDDGKMSNNGFIGGQKENTKTPCFDWSGVWKSSTRRVTTLKEVSCEQPFPLDWEAERENIKNR